MESRRSSASASNISTKKPSKIKSSAKDKVASKNASGDCGVSESTSHTQFFRKKKMKDEYVRISKEKYYGVQTSDESSDSFGCIYGPEGKHYTESEKLERTLLHELDPVPIERAWNDSYPPAYGWQMASKLVFLVTEAAPLQQLDRLNAHLRDFAATSQAGYRIDCLDDVTVILDFLYMTYKKETSLREGFELLLKNVQKPIILSRNADIATYFDNVTNYLGFIGCLLIGLEEDELFAVVSDAMLWHLSAADAQRPAEALRRRATLLAAAPALYHTAVRMLAVATSRRFPTFLQMALFLATASPENCIELLKENILENIFSRFNPYFPERKLPWHAINPADPQDHNVQLGDSGVHLRTTLILLLVLLKTLKHANESNPKFHEDLPVPNAYAQRCFIWAFRYECRARDHHAQRTTLTVITSALLWCFGSRISELSYMLMPDVMSLSVATEIPLQKGWASTVNFNISQEDVQFKKVLIYLCIDFLHVFPPNRFLIESQHWFVGLMYLLDPGLSQLRLKWAPSLYEELRLTALQALVSVLPLADADLPSNCGLIRRIMWYVEWYSWSPFQLGVLYWCLRLLLAAIGRRGSPPRPLAVRDLLDTHGVIILMHLCSTLTSRNNPPVEMQQVVIAMCLRLLASGLQTPNAKVTCEVYPQIKWPTSINTLARTMMHLVMNSLERSYIISDRWLIALLNFIWEGIIWKNEYRKQFVANNGVYQLLDLITMTRASVQCVALALVCDITTAGGAISQLISWRASATAANAHPRVVNAGATIASLLASIFRDECCKLGLKLSIDGVIQDLENPLRSERVRKTLEYVKSHETVLNPDTICHAAADLAGSRMSKVYALLQMLSQDLNDKVLIADEAYKLYKHIRLAPGDEVILVLSKHFLTLKLMETWSEIQLQSPGYESHDEVILEEFLHINKGWTQEIKRQQEEVVELNRKKSHEEECSLYTFLARARLTTALDALREVRGDARASSRERLTHAMLSAAVCAHHRRLAQSAALNEPVLRTYTPPLDEKNATAQYVKTYSIPPKDTNNGSTSITLYSVTRCDR